MRRLERYVEVGSRRLRCGYTTGTCAAAAARAAAELLFLGRAVPAVLVQTPSGMDVTVDVEECESGEGWAACAVRKDAGDDPDVTDGVLVWARVEMRDEPGIAVEGGVGVGRVTRPGLDQPVGAAAINSVPRRMIVEQVEEVVHLADGGGGPARSSTAKRGLFEHGIAPAAGDDPLGLAGSGEASGSPRLDPRENRASEHGDYAGKVRLVPESSALAWTGHALEGAVPAGRSEEPDASPEPAVSASSSCAALPSGDGMSTGDRPNGRRRVGMSTGDRPHYSLRETYGAKRDDVASMSNGACPQYSFSWGVLVTVSIPEGVELAGRTFNPKLGVEGGISVIGTSGIVRPMSEEAVVESIRLEMGQRRAEGSAGIVVVPGNYGADFARDALGIVQEPVACSNYVGEMLDEAVRLGFDWLLVVGHIGKMAKVAGGAMNTHSRVADGRMETLAALAGAQGAPADVLADVLDAATTDAALDVLAEAGVLDAVMKRLAERIGYHVNNRTNGHPQVEAVVFSKARGLLGQTAGAAALVSRCAEGGDGL